MPKDPPEPFHEEQSFWIGDKLIEPKLNQISSQGQTKLVERQTMKVLLILAAQPDQAISREDILKRVWRNSPNDEGLTQAISKLRKALGDSPGQESVIQTIRKVGYRLVAPVSSTQASETIELIPKRLGQLDRQPTRSIRIRIDGRWLAAAMLFGVAVIMLTLLS